ncbi:MAG: DUF2306 domain-containing protein [Kofleriaceae bacterium]|nr:DUF2306 domain-containing protein [Kofleriaceae bacterium]
MGPGRRVARLFVWLGLALGSLVITRGSLAYFDDEEYAPFMLEKLEFPLPDEAQYEWVLKLHVVAAAFALPACLLLLLRVVQRRAPRVHRWVGRVNGAVTLLALVPSGAYLSRFATGGLPSTLGFLTSGAIVAVAMVQGIRTARARQFVAHRRWMLHVLAQMAVAVVSRAMLIASAGAGFDPIHAYIACLWLPVIGCALFVEWITGSLPLPWRNHHASHSRTSRHHHLEPRLR